MLGSDSSQRLISSLKQNPGIAIHWTAEEQKLLEKLLTKYASSSHSRVACYAAIASHFQEKTIRDVVLRCRWMTVKEDENIRKDYPAANVNPTIKGISAEDCPKGENCNSQAINFDTNDNGHISITNIEGKARELLAENSEMLNKMSANLDNFLPDDNFLLAWQIRQNLQSLIVNNAANIPEKGEWMPPIPGIEEQLFNAIFVHSSNPADFSEQHFREIR